MKHFIFRNANRFCSLLGYHLEKNKPASPAPVKLPKKKVDYSWLKKQQIKTFIDIGAYHGEYFDFAAEHFPAARIIAFEPQPDAINFLEQKATTLPNVTLFNLALGETNSSATFYISGYAPSSSVLPMGELHKQISPESGELRPVTVEMKTLDSVLADSILEENIFIKMDSQGYEDRIIAGGKKIFSQATVILTEVSFAELYEGQKLFDTIYLQLKELGFVLVGFKNQIYSPLDGRILQAHVYFIKQ